MVEIQKTIDKINEPNIESILYGVNSDIPILIYNAIVSGTRNHVENIEFINGIRKNKENDIELLHIPLSKISIASLDILGIEKYDGDDDFTKRLISSKFDF